tara:strand:+ start:282 stop:911 length:630 start_codon:yes stop_codon:yes gene_type:complete
MSKVNELLTPFSTPIHITKYEKDMTKEFDFVKNLDYVMNGGESNQANRNYKSSKTDVLKSPELQTINDFIQKSLDYYTSQILEATQRVIPTLSWTNKNPQNSRHHEHVHPNSIISGVFYFSTTDTTPIKFHKADRWGLKLEYKNFNNYNGESIYVPITSGELILFPSSTTHSVPTNQSNVVRYSLSFNTFTETGEVGSKSQLTYLNIKE